MKKKYQIPESSIKTKVLRASILAGSTTTGNNTPDNPGHNTEIADGGVEPDARRRTSPSLLDV